MTVLGRITLKLVFIFELLRVVGAVYCRYETVTGDIDHMFCLQKCCDSQERYSSAQICCSYKRDHEIFIGAGMATIIVISVFAICFLYICCKEKIMRQSREYSRRHQNTRLRPSRSRQSSEDCPEIPNISSQIDPVLPPPYEALPPAYSQLASTQSKTNSDKTNPYGPPPAYTLHDASLP